MKKLAIIFVFLTLFSKHVLRDIKNEVEFLKNKDCKNSIIINLNF